MKIYFFGLSCFLIENKKGFLVLVDPFNDAPECRLGPVFPKKLNGKNIGANIVLISEPDADHSRNPNGWLHNAPATKPNSDPFPDFNLKGTIVYEYNGDVNIAWHYNIDGLRLAHFADNAHLLTKEQLKEIGNPDIIFISPPKTEPTNSQALDTLQKNIELLKPKIIFWAHHIAPKNLPKQDDSESLRKFFVHYLKENANTNKHYKDEKSFIELCYILENAINLNKEYSGYILDKPAIKIDSSLVKQVKKKTKCFLFKTMLANSFVE